MNSYRIRLSELIQNRIRQSVTINYHIRQSSFGVTAAVSICGARWNGGAQLDEKSAKESAAMVAFHALTYLSETQIRNVLVLPQRQFIPEMDEVRDALRSLKARMKSELGTAAAKPKIQQLGHLYSHIDRIEKELLS